MNSVGQGRFELARHKPRVIGDEVVRYVLTESD